MTLSKPNAVQLLEYDMPGRFEELRHKNAKQPQKLKAKRPLPEREKAGHKSSEDPDWAGAKYNMH